MKLERKGELFLIKSTALREDSWTGGDYRQYVANRDDGSLHPCRPVMIPFYGTLAGFTLLGIMAMFILQFPAGDPAIRWERVYGAAVIGFFMFIAGLVLQFGPYRLMKAVQWRSYDGMRHFYYEPQPSREVTDGV